MLRGLAPPVPADGFPLVLIRFTQLAHQSSSHTPSFLRLSGYPPWSLGPSALYSYSSIVSEAVKVKLQDGFFFFFYKEDVCQGKYQVELAGRRVVLFRGCRALGAGGLDGRGGTLGMSFGGYTHFCFDQSSLGFLSTYP